MKATNSTGTAGSSPVCSSPLGDTRIGESPCHRESQQKDSREACETWRETGTFLKHLAPETQQILPSRLANLACKICRSLPDETLENRLSSAGLYAPAPSQLCVYRNLQVRDLCLQRMGIPRGRHNQVYRFLQWLLLNSRNDACAGSRDTCASSKQQYSASSD